MRIQKWNGELAQTGPETSLTGTNDIDTQRERKEGNCGSEDGVLKDGPVRRVKFNEAKNAPG